MKFMNIPEENFTLQPWDSRQIQSFYEIYCEKTERSVSEMERNNIIKNREILGIPLILYMMMAINISIDEEDSIVDVYDRIFSLKDGGIYERCFKNLEENKLERYDDTHWISLLKEPIHQISRDIAIWMFENNPNRASIPQKEYRNICGRVIKEQQIQRGESIENALNELSNKSQKEFAGSIAQYLKKGELSQNISQYLRHKLSKQYSILDSVKQQNFYWWWESAINKMMDVGMFYYSKPVGHEADGVFMEVRCFMNLMEMLRIVPGADLVGTNLMKADLEGANLRKADLRAADLREANLRKADFRGAVIEYVRNGYTKSDEQKLASARLKNACINGSIWREKDIRKLRQLNSTTFIILVIEDENGNRMPRRGISK